MSLVITFTVSIQLLQPKSYSILTITSKLHTFFPADIESCHQPWVHFLWAMPEIFGMALKSVQPLYLIINVGIYYSSMSYCCHFTGSNLIRMIRLQHGMGCKPLLSVQMWHEMNMHGMHPDHQLVIIWVPPFTLLANLKRQYSNR